MIWVKAALLVTAPLFLALGIVLPLVRFETLYVFSDNPSLLEIVVSLWDEGNPALGVLVALLSIVFPVVKMTGIAAEAIGAGQGSTSQVLLDRLVPVLSRWSMMDVLLVALVIFAAKTSGIAQAFTQPGLWFYAGSSVLAGVLHGLPKRSVA
jgi:paraquat-inducible protein A